MAKDFIEVPAMRRCAGIKLISDRIADETTIPIFRHLQEKHEQREQILESVKTHVSTGRKMIRVKRL